MLDTLLTKAMLIVTQSNRTVDVSPLLSEYQLKSKEIKGIERKMFGFWQLPAKGNCKFVKRTRKNAGKMKKKKGDSDTKKLAGIYIIYVHIHARTHTYVHALMPRQR